MCHVMGWLQDTADTSYTWHQVTVTNNAGGSMGLHSAACAVIGNVIYVAGGNRGMTAYGSWGSGSANLDDRSNMLYAFDTSSASWSAVSLQLCVPQLKAMRVSITGHPSP